LSRDKSGVSRTARTRTAIRRLPVSKRCQWLDAAQPPFALISPASRFQDYSPYVDVCHLPASQSKMSRVVHGYGLHSLDHPAIQSTNVNRTSAEFCFPWISSILPPALCDDSVSLNTFNRKLKTLHTTNLIRRRCDVSMILTQRYCQTPSTYPQRSDLGNIYGIVRHFNSQSSDNFY